MKTIKVSRNIKSADRHFRLLSAFGIPMKLYSRKYKGKIYWIARPLHNKEK